MRHTLGGHAPSKAPRSQLLTRIIRGARIQHRLPLAVFADARGAECRAETSADRGRRRGKMVPPLTTASVAAGALTTTNVATTAITVAL